MQSAVIGICVLLSVAAVLFFTTSCLLLRLSDDRMRKGTSSRSLFEKPQLANGLVFLRLILLDLHTYQTLV